jgi:hypothetical protein
MKKSDRTGRGYFLAQDNDCHWYLVPRDNERSWQEWKDIDPEDAASWTPPKFAVRIGGSPSLVTFSNWQIGKE